MSERYNHPTGQLRLRPRSSRRINLVVGAGTAAVLALLVLNVMVWSNWSGRPAPVGATQTPPASASPAPTESPAPPEPTASPSPASPGQGGGAEPAPVEPETSEEPAEPGEPAEPESTVVVIDPAVVLPSITPTVTEVVPAGCLASTTASGAIEVSALDIWYPMTVEYRWLRSGEFVGPTQSVEVDANTTLPVSTQWPSTEAAGWVSLEVTSAFGAVSEKVTFPSCLA